MPFQTSNNINEKIYYQKIRNNKFDYETIDGFLDSGSDAFKITGDSYGIESTTKKRDTMMGYDSEKS